MTIPALLLISAVGASAAYLGGPAGGVRRPASANGRHASQTLRPAHGPATTARPVLARAPPGRMSEAEPRASGGLSPSDPRLVTVTLDRVTGIDFGCDLSLRWPYVMSLVPMGSAERSGQVRIGDQLVAVGRQGVLGLTVSDAMTKMAEADGSDIEVVLYRASREELQEALAAMQRPPETVQVTVMAKGNQPARSFAVPYGANLRDELVKRRINVYQSVTRWTNCDGKQLCGTCIVDVVDGLDSCSRRSLDESSTLRENPETYKLACITQVYGDVVVEIHPKVGAAQWTR